MGYPLCSSRFPYKAHRFYSLSKAHFAKPAKSWFYNEITKVIANQRSIMTSLSISSTERNQKPFKWRVKSPKKRKTKITMGLQSAKATTTKKKMKKTIQEIGNDNAKLNILLHTISKLF